jgi:hypothetical protein
MLIETSRFDYKMKTIATLAILALSADAALIKRQDHDHSSMGSMGSMGSKGLPGGFDFKNIGKAFGKGGLLSSFLNPETRMAYKIEELKPVVRPEAKRVRITYGPYKIRASNVGFISV